MRAWGEGWWDMPVTVGDLLGRIMALAPGTARCTRTSRSPRRSSSPASTSRASAADRLRGGQLPDGQLPVPGAGASAARRSWSCPTGTRCSNAIDERTLLVPVTHVLFKTGHIQDVAAIARRAHEVGAHVLLDVYQSVGTVPLDVTALGVDFAVGGSVKWLCGGPGAGYLYVRPDLAERLEPSLTGWQAHARPFAFEPGAPLCGRAPRASSPARRTCPRCTPRTAGYDLIEELGVERIREHSMGQTDLLVELPDAAGFEVTAPRDPERRGGTVTVRTPDFEAVHAELAEREILCDFRPGGRPARAALLQHRRRAPLRGRPDRRDRRVRCGAARGRGGVLGRATRPPTRCGGAASSSAEGSGRCSRTDTAAGSPGVPARPPRKARPASPR